MSFSLCKCILDLIPIKYNDSVLVIYIHDCNFLNFILTLIVFIVNTA